MASFLKYSDLRLRTQPLVTLPSSSSPTLSHKFHRKETKTDDRTKRREDTVELATHSKIIIFNYFGKEMSFPTASFFLAPLPTSQSPHFHRHSFVYLLSRLRIFFPHSVDEKMRVSRAQHTKALSEKRTRDIYF